MTIENGQVIDTHKVRDNELIASMDTFFWMAKKAGYRVISPEDETEQEQKQMKDNRTASAIDLAFQKHETPVGPLFVAMRYGRMKRCFSRKTALRYLAFFMTTKVFGYSGFPQCYESGETTVEYDDAYKRCIRRLRRILARKREVQKWSKKYDAWVAQRDELMKQRPY